MKNNVLVSLKQQFSQLPLASVADDWLESIDGKNVPEQLRERKISTIHFAPLISSGGLGIQEESDNFFVLLNDSETSEQNAQTLGHEIGHTFFYNLRKKVPVDLLPKDLAEETQNLIEEFCDKFSSRWLVKNGKENIILRCRNQARLI